MAAPLYLLHPFPLDSRFWDGVRARLSPERETVAPEFPGFGGTPQAQWRIDDAAERLADRMAAGPGGRALICGLSMGGYVALAIACRRPEVVAGLVLADTRAEADDATALQGRRAGARLIRERGLRPYLDGLLGGLVADPAATEAVRAIALEQHPEAVVAALAALAARRDRTRDLGAIAAPTLVIVGEHDRPTPISAAQALIAGIGGARLAIIPGAGHLSAIEQPTAFARLVADALADWSV